MSVVVALALAFLPGLAAARGDAHGLAYDGGRIVQLARAHAGHAGAVDLGGWFQVGTSRERATHYDSTSD